MEHIESGPSTERIVRSLLMFLLVATFASAFLLDGFYGYAYNNVRQVAKLIGHTEMPLPRPDPRLTEEAGRQLASEIDRGAPRAEVEGRLGPPDFVNNADSYYLGPGGHLLAKYERDRLQSLEWVDGTHNETDIDIQRWIGLALAVFAGGLLVNFLRAARFRTVLCDEGLRIGRGPVLPFSAIRAMQMDPESLKGRVLIQCELEGNEGTIALDAYHVKRLEEIVRGIESRTGLQATRISPEPELDEGDNDDGDEENDTRRERDEPA